MKISKIASAIIMAAAFSVAPASASSDYGLVVEVTNKLIDNVKLLEADVATLSEKVEHSDAAKEEDVAERDKALSEVAALKEKLEVNERRIMELEANMDMMVKRIESLSNQSVEAMPTEVLQEQEDRLKAYLSPEDAGAK